MGRLRSLLPPFQTDDRIGKGMVKCYPYSCEGRASLRTQVFQLCAAQPLILLDCLHHSPTFRTLSGPVSPCLAHSAFELCLETILFPSMSAALVCLEPHLALTQFPQSPPFPMMSPMALFPQSNLQKGNRRAEGLLDCSHAMVVP